MKTTAAPPRGLNYTRVILLLATFFILFVAMMFRTPPIVIMAATLCATLACATPPLGTVIARFWGRGLVAQRQLPASGQTGDIIGGRLRLENTGRSPALLVHVQAGQVALPTQQRPAPKTAVALVSEAEHIVPVLRSGESIEFSPRWLLQKRGVFSLSPVMAGARDPLGLFAALFPRTPAQEILVMPRPLRIERLGLAGGARNSPQTSQNANITAEALDFHGVRPWRAGEPIRRVHWKSTARTGELHIVEWEDSPGSDISVIFDAHAIAPQSGGDDEAFESAIVMIASVGAYCLENGYRFQLFCEQGALSNDGEYSQIQMNFSATAASETKSLLETLARLQPLSPLAGSNFSELCVRTAPHIGRGAAVLLTGGATADFAGALRSLHAASANSFQSIAFDAASFGDSDFSDKPQVAPNLPKSVRLVRTGDSLSEILERLA